jgi:hypothetical protein
MSLKPFYSEGGFGVSNATANTTTIVVYANTDISSGNLTSVGTVDFTNTSNVTLGNVSNLHISGGNSGYVLSTDGTGSLSWVAQSGGGGNSYIVSNMPTYIAAGDTYYVVANTQALFALPITIDGTFQIDGILVEV